MNIDLEQLKQAAQAAGPEGWHTTQSVGNGAVYVSTDGKDSGDVCLAGSEPKSTFIAAANPAVVLALIARLAQAEAIRSVGWNVNLAAWQRTIARIQDPAVRASMMEFLMKIDQAATDYVGREQLLRDALELAQAGSFGGYVIEHADGTRWRTLDSIGMPDWTDDRMKALCFSLREHADTFAGEDPEDVRIVTVLRRERGGA